MRGLFWNTHNATTAGAAVASMTVAHQADIVVLAQCGIDDGTLLGEFGKVGASGYNIEPLNSRLRLLHRCSKAQALYDDNVMSIRAMTLGTCPEVLLVMVHLPSKLRYSTDDQAALCPEYIAEIRRAEVAVRHGRTLVVGDFNMNPFELGMVQATGFHSVATRALAVAAGRQVQGRRYDFFYNPMWRFFGDPNGRPAGTWWCRESRPVAYFWHMFDQILVRPNLVRYFDDGVLAILTNAGTTALLKSNGLPDAAVSDHLPLTFGLDFSR